ncbi:MAG: type II secretion system GspH family protein [Rickettsiales bacterium]|nr:type II secretion system GspH family protein [Rickettsiales bacterium]
MKKNRAFSLIELSIVLTIISVFIAGIMEGRILVKKAKISDARSRTTSSPVASLGGLVLWYETTLEESFSTSEAKDGNTISTWYDLNPNIETVKNNATQTTSGNRPTYKTNQINGLPVVQFTSTNSNYLSFDGTNIANSAFTIFVVEQRTANRSNNYFIAGSDSSNNTNLTLGYKTSSSMTTSLVNNYLDYSISSYTTPTPLIHSFTFNFITKSYYINGTIQNSPTTGGSAYNIAQATTSLTAATLGFSTLTSSYYQGNIGEVIIFKKYLGTDDRKAVENYLGKKWGITVS